MLGVALATVALCLISGAQAATPPDPAIVLTPRPAAPQKSLDDNWQFRVHSSQATADSASGGDSWKPIKVPGHWVMQGFDVPPDTAVDYRQHFQIPDDWQGRRIKLRFDGVYSDAAVSLNGQVLGRHVGGFTPFEFDVTDVARMGQANHIDVTVKRESPADLQMTTFGTAYAKTPLGGITRKVTLFAVPEVHLSRLHLQTTFDAEYRDAVLHVELAVINEGPAPAKDIRLRLDLVSPDRQHVEFEPREIDLATIAAGTTVTRHVQIPVASPAKWDCEHPNLYGLECSVLEKDNLQATVRQPVGFRQVAVAGKQLLVNGRPVKLRGVCRHEMYAATGRVNSPELSRHDVELFREANVNLIRTSHYPPAEEFLNACDELGMFVEEESPFHHAQPIVTPEYRSLFLQQAAEVIERDRNRPSVIIWSLGNESDWSPNFAASAEMVRRLDPSRPRLFAEGYNHFAKYPRDDVYHSLEIASWHYPGMSNVVPQSTATTKPLLFDEYCHGNCYNREEIATDPGLRDQWGECLAAIWQPMYANEGCLGGAIWGGIDEVWNLPDGTEQGWGRWGLLDSWHRRKPEYWHTKKVYSPVQVRLISWPEPGSDQPLRLQVENRHDFTNLNELRIAWTLGQQAGSATLDVPPRSFGTLTVQPKAPPKAGERFRIEFHSPRGFLINIYQWPVGEDKSPEKTTASTHSELLRLTQSDREIVISNATYSFIFDRRTGILRSANVDGSGVLCGGPTLMLLPIGPHTPNQTHQASFPPLTSTCTGWKAKSVNATETESGVEVCVEGSYDETEGSFRIRLGGAGAMTVDYRFVCKAKIAARQVGVVFDLPERCDRLSWQRDGQWTVYPDDHIGRLAGTAMSKRTGTWPQPEAAGRPSWPWAYDESPLGTNDFRATRTGIRNVSLANPAGRGFRAVSDGTQAARAWLDNSHVRLLIADYARGTGERFLRAKDFPAAQPLNLKPGDSIEGSVEAFLMNSPNNRK